MEHTRCRLALILSVPSKTRNGPVWTHFLDRNRASGSPLRRMDHPNGHSFLMVWASLLGSKKHESLKIRKSNKTPNESTKNECCSRRVFLAICFLRKEKRTLQNAFFLPNGPSYFYTLFSTICGTLKTNKWAPGSQFRFWVSYNGPRDSFEDQGGLISGRQVLSVSVEIACVCGDCHGVLMTCFCAVSLSGAM